MTPQCRSEFAGALTSTKRLATNTIIMYNIPRRLDHQKNVSISGKRWFHGESEAFRNPANSPLKESR